MPVTEMIIGIAGGSLILLGVVAILRLIGIWITHQTVRRAIEKDPAIAEPLLDRITTSREPTGDDRIGLILLAVGVAAVIASLTAGDTGGWTDYGIGASMFPLIVGAALMGRHLLIKRAKRRANAE